MRKVSVRNKIAVVLLLMLVLLTATTYAIQKLVVLPSFTKLERAAARQDLGRCLNAIRWDLNSLSNTANDWATWDDSYRYIQDRNKEFERCNLVDVAFSNTKSNLIACLDGNAKIVWGQMRDIDTLKLLQAPDVFQALQLPGGPFVRHESVDDSLEGILLTNEGPMLVASRPIITSDRKGPIRGAVVMGRLLSAEVLQAVAERTRVQVHIWSIPRGEVPPDDKAALREVLAENPSVLRIVSRKTLHAYGKLDDIYGQPALLVRADIERSVTAQGAIAARIASVASIVGGLVVAATLWLLLQKLIVRPLQRLTAHAERIGRMDDLKARLSLDRADEIGSLAREFDAMVEQLADSRKKMLDMAYQAGMAEIASEVLHNVGNVVNSAGIAGWVLERRLRSSKIEGLERVMRLVQEQQPRLAEFFTHDPRGTKVIKYLGRLTAVLREEYTANLQDVQQMRETVGHIRDVVTLQQTYAGHGDFKQAVDARTLLEDVVRMHAKDIAAHDIVVERHYEPISEIEVNKNKLMQVVMNLVKNAVRAIRDQQGSDRRLILGVRMPSPRELHIEVSDTGVGIDLGNQVKIFNHGFTTKPEGHGFGLHFSANAVKEMGGVIQVESEGPGRGARFRVTVPVEPSSTAA